MEQKKAIIVIGVIFTTIIICGLAVSLYFIFRPNNSKAPTITPNITSTPNTTRAPTITTRAPTITPNTTSTPNITSTPINIDFNKFNIYHPLSGKCLHPKSIDYDEDVIPLVLYNGCGNNDRILFEQAPNGIIRHVESGFCLKIENDSNQNDSKLILNSDCGDIEGEDYENIKFTFDDNKNIKHQGSSKCIHPKSTETYENDSFLVIYDGCGENSRIQFEKLINGVLPTVAPIDNRYFNIYHPLSSKCIHPQDGIGNNNTGAVLYNTCGSNDSILYKQLANGAIQHKASGRCFIPENNSTNNDTRLILIDNCAATEVQYEFLANGSIKHKFSDKCLHPKSDDTYPVGTNIVIYSGCEGGGRTSYHKMFR